jgi:hypothetical protein
MAGQAARNGSEGWPSQAQGGSRVLPNQEGEGGRLSPRQPPGRRKKARSMTEISAICQKACCFHGPPCQIIFCCEMVPFAFEFEAAVSGKATNQKTRWSRPRITNFNSHTQFCGEPFYGTEPNSVTRSYVTLRPWANHRISIYSCRQCLPIALNLNIFQ